MDRPATYENLWHYEIKSNGLIKVFKRRLLVDTSEQMILSRVDDDAALRDARLSFVELGTLGTGQSVIGLHGFAARGRSLLPTLSHLADQGIQVLLPDLLGHCFS